LPTEEDRSLGDILACLRSEILVDASVAIIPVAFLLKALQAAVLGGAPRIEIFLRKQQVEVRASLAPVQGLTLMGLLSQPMPELQGLALYLRWAAVCALALNPHRLEIHFGGEQVVWQDGKVTLQSGGPDFKMVLDCFRPMGQIQLASVPAFLLSDISQRCALCPIPVLVDARQVNQGSPDALASCRPSSFQGDYSFPSYRWLAERVHLDDGLEGPALAPPCARTARTYCLNAGPALPGSSHEPHSALSWFLRPEDELRVERRSTPRLTLSADQESKGLRSLVLYAPDDPQRSPAQAFEAAGWIPLCEASLGDEERPCLEGLHGCRYSGFKLNLPNARVQALCVRAYVALRMHPDQEAQLSLYQHGVLLECLEPLGLPPGVVAILERNDTQTLGPLAVALTDPADLAWLRSEVRLLWEACRKLVTDVQAGEAHRIPLAARTAWRKTDWSRLR